STRFRHTDHLNWRGEPAGNPYLTSSLSPVRGAGIVTSISKTFELPLPLTAKQYGSPARECCLDHLRTPPTLSRGSGSRVRAALLSKYSELAAVKTVGSVINCLNGDGRALEVAF